MSFLEKWGVSFDEAVHGLDELTVERDGNVQYCIGLVCTLYFKNGSDAAVRQKVIQCFDLYQKQTDYKLIWGAEPLTWKPKKISGTQIANLASWVPNLHPKDSMSLVFHGGKKRNDANHYTVRSLSEELRPGKLSYFSVTLPLTWIACHPQGAFIKLVLEFCNILHPWHGYAGLALIPFVNVSRGTSIMDEFRALVNRFHGLEIDFPSIHARLLRDGIKGVNWLTILDQFWFDRLNGKEALREELGEGFVFHDFDSGTAIQAGPHPAFGDVNRNERLPYYIKLSQALKSIRAEYPDSFGRNGYFNRDQVQEWRTRFDNIKPQLRSI